MRIQESCPGHEQLVHVWLWRPFFQEFAEKGNERKAVSTKTALYKSLLSQSPKEHTELQIIFSTLIIQEIGFEPERDAFFYNAFITTCLLV